MHLKLEITTRLKWCSIKIKPSTPLKRGIYGLGYHFGHEWLSHLVWTRSPASGKFIIVVPHRAYQSV